MLPHSKQYLHELMKYNNTHTCILQQIDATTTRTPKYFRAALSGRTSEGHIERVCYTA